MIIQFMNTEGTGSIKVNNAFGVVGFPPVAVPGAVDFITALRPLGIVTAERFDKLEFVE